MNIYETIKNLRSKMCHDRLEQNEIELVYQIGVALSKLTDDSLCVNRTGFKLSKKGKHNEGFYITFKMNDLCFESLPTEMQDELLSIDKNSPENIYIELAQDLYDSYQRVGCEWKHLRTDAWLEYPAVNIISKINGVETEIFNISKRVTWVIFGGNENLIQNYTERCWCESEELNELSQEETFVNNGLRIMNIFSNMFKIYLKTMLFKSKGESVNITKYFYATRNCKLLAFKSGVFQILAESSDCFTDDNKIITISFENDEYSDCFLITDGKYCKVCTDVINMGWKNLFENGYGAPNCDFNVTPPTGTIPVKLKEWVKPFFKMYMLQDFLYYVINDIDD